MAAVAISCRTLPGLDGIETVAGAVAVAEAVAVLAEPFPAWTGLKPWRRRPSRWPPRARPCRTLPGLDGIETSGSGLAQVAERQLAEPFPAWTGLKQVGFQPLHHLVILAEPFPAWTGLKPLDVRDCGLMNFTCRTLPGLDGIETWL